MNEASRQLLAAIRALAEPVVERFGCELVAIEIGSGPSNWRILRVSIDKVGGATITDCAHVSRALSPALDVEDKIPEAYDLEVSTPGMERPLQREQDFVRFAGCDVRVKLYGQDSRRRIKVRILGCEAGVVRLGADDGERLVPIEDIERANLVLTLEQYARLGQGLHPIGDES